MKRMAFIALIIVLFSPILGCSTTPVRQETTPVRQEATKKQPHYTDFSVDRNLPSSEAEKVKQCQWIRNEIARVQSIIDTASSMLDSTMDQTYIRILARKNIAWLNGRAAALKCRSAFSPYGNDPSQTEFDDCYNKCLKYTDYTKNECFDRCNK
ncbi:MAG: hypothetical protein SRB1_02696 [Desulfobacteraceae bacterium Eth-SRB1]|nr:MAG: hypothetical protein SRB1_02696 [Desulfobacteraceae bacterium Eth-SRB1]